MTPVWFDLNALRSEVVSTCESMGLVDHAAKLTTVRIHKLDALRTELVLVRVIATAMATHAVHATCSATVTEALVHASTLAKAMRLEKLASAAIVALDRVERERGVSL